MALKEFKLPDVGEGVAEGELVQWLVEPGDTVSEDQPVAEVETDKALVEVPSPYNGTVKELHAEEGEMVPVGDVIVTYEIEGEAGEEAEAEAAEAEAETEAEPAEEEAAAAAEAAVEAETETEVPDARVFAPPSARRLARELGVDISAVEGSGPGGRVTERDVREHAEGEAPRASTASGETASAPATEPAAETTEVVEAEPTPEQPAEVEATGPAAEPAEAAGRERTLAAPATRKAAEELGVDLDDVPTDETRDGEAFVTPEQVRQYAEAQREARSAASEAAEAGGAGAAGAEAAGAEERVETVPYRGVRRTIGEQMQESKYTAPHVTHHDTVVIDELVETREELKPRAEERGVKLTYMPFVMKAIVAALKEYPYLNSELDEEAEEIRLKNYYNVGVAVATDAGLMVPVVEDVDEKSVVELAEEVNDKAARARERKLSREEMQGGTFTITNFGAIGGEYATPIINYPETAIMGLGAIEKRPVVQEVEEGGMFDEGETTEQVVPAHTLPLSLSIDHRIIDGAVAGQFTNEVMEYLNNPSLLLLD